METVPAHGGLGTSLRLDIGAGPIAQGRMVLGEGGARGLPPHLRRRWVARVHLQAGQCVARASWRLTDFQATASGMDVEDVHAIGAARSVRVVHLAPRRTHGSPFSPFGGAGTRPAAGLIAELALPPTALARTLDVQLAEGKQCDQATFV